MFSSEQELTAGTNRVGLCYLKRPMVSVLAFCLSEEKLSVILSGALMDCRKYSDHYIKQTVNWWAVHDLPGTTTDIILSFHIIEKESGLRLEIANLLRGSLLSADNMYDSLLRWSRWSSGRFYFNTFAPGSVIGLMGERSRMEMFGTKQIIPGYWCYDSSGLIRPSDYLDVGFVENLYGSLSQFRLYLFNSGKEPPSGCVGSVFMRIFSRIRRKRSAMKNLDDRRFSGFNMKDD